MKRYLLLFITVLFSSCGFDMETLYEKNPMNQLPIDKYNPLKRPPHSGYDHLVEEYRDIPLVDVHSHDSAFFFFPYFEKWRSLYLWKKYGVDYVAISGAISAPAAVLSDRWSLRIYQQHPERFFPHFAGFDVHDEASLDVIRRNLEIGYFGIGEFVAASSYSPAASGLAWKGEDPMDGYFPEIYEILAKYKAPILLHIDPLRGLPLAKLEEALKKYPDTVFILGHANAYSDPAVSERLLSRYENLYIDYYAAFDLFNDDSWCDLEDYVPLIEEYSDRVLVSSDSGFDMGYENAYLGIYALFSLLEDDTVRKIAFENYEGLMNAQPMTGWQEQEIRNILNRKPWLNVDYSDFNKRQAGEWIWNHQRPKHLN